jgi:hypothetical protein
MNSQDAIQQELKDFGSSLPFKNVEQPVFTVPDGYFENFAASVWAKLKSQQELSAADEVKDLSPVLAAISKQTPFSVPENYFTHLATGLPALVNDEALPEFLQSHTKQMPYAVPNGYFEELAAQVAAKVTKQKAKVVPLSVRFMRYAAAAAIVGILVLGSLLYVGRNRTTTVDLAKQPSAWIAQKLKNVSNTDLEAFLKNLNAESGSTELAQKGGKTEVRSLLHDVSNRELDAFLNELPADTDLSGIN